MNFKHLYGILSRKDIIFGVIIENISSMRKSIMWLLCISALTAGMSVYGEASSPQENMGTSDSTARDTTIAVIGWYNKHDTVTYWVNKGGWNVDDSDTIPIASVSMKVRINVVDSTPEGYKMDYTILEYPVDTLPESASYLEKFKHQLTTRLAGKIVGTTVHFETDEYGRIIKYNNLAEVKKRVKAVSKEVLKSISQLPEVKQLKKKGMDITSYAKNVDTDKMVEGYLEELDLLFLNHGHSVSVGEFTEHENATDSTFEKTTYIAAGIDADDGAYHIMYNVTTIVPQNSLKSLIGGLVQIFGNDSVKDNFNEKFDKEVKVNATNRDCLKTDYLVNGWPYYLVKQKFSMAGNRGKIKQTVIYLDSYYFAP